MNHQKEQAGFTVVELIMTILIAASFIASISQMISFVNGVAYDARLREVASNLAYNNLRLYANGEPPRWFDCNGDDVTDTEATSPFTDGSKHPDATGQVLIDTTSTDPVEGLTPPVTQKVTAVAPYGCGNTVTGMPVRILSVVTYGSPVKEMVHATYVGY